MKYMKHVLSLACCCLSVFLFACESVCSANDIEKAKIEYLISSIGELKGAKFIRNGSEHDTQATVAHLRRKLKAAGTRITTVEQFIEYIASKSSLSGEPYTIKMTDGTVMKSEVFFRNKLKSFSYTENRR